MFFFGLKGWEVKIFQTTVGYVILNYLFGKTKAAICSHLREEFLTSED